MSVSQEVTVMKVDFACLHVSWTSFCLLFTTHALLDAITAEQVRNSSSPFLSLTISQIIKAF
jgi:hypothetical protein